MNKDFTIGTLQFKVSKIGAFKQFHIVRRLAPIMADLAPAAVKLSKKKDKEQMSEQETIEAIAPIVNGLSKLTDADADKVLLGLLSAVEIKQDGAGWARLADENGLMFENLELPILMQAAGRAFMYNLQGFFAVLPQVSPGRE